MSLVIELSPDRERVLREQASGRGQSPEEFARLLLEQSLRDPERVARINRFFAEARTAAAAHGLSEAELAEEVRLACEAERSISHARTEETAADQVD